MLIPAKLLFTRRSRLLACLGLLLLLLLLACTPIPLASHPQVIFQDDFRHGLDHWFLEAAAPGRVEARDGLLTIDVPAGCTLWLRQPLEGPILIEYQARAVQAGGPNDRVSDLNCFWMAFDPEHPEDLFARPRTGRFEEYHRLRCYYASIGGNNNTTSRFRRYIGDPEHRPLLPQHDLRDPEFLLVPNRWQTIQLIAAGSRIEFWRDGRLLFYLDDPQPYTRGQFAFRTVASHLEIRNFRIFRLPPDPGEPRTLPGEPRTSVHGYPSSSPQPTSGKPRLSP